MDSPLFYRLAADAILVLHFSIVLFIVVGLFLILLGKLKEWTWVKNPWFRLLHLIAIGFVVLQAWAGEICPLTTWEMMLRVQAGDVTYSGSFIAHWLEVLLYYRAPPWVFSLIYTLFGGLVVFSWFWVKPRKFFG